MLLKLEKFGELELCESFGMNSETIGLPPCKQIVEEYKCGENKNLIFVYKAKNLFCGIWFCIAYQYSKGYTTTFQPYWWRMTSGALLCIISGINECAPEWNHQRSISYLDSFLRQSNSMSD
jgi:hypothetical protein